MNRRTTLSLLCILACASPAFAGLVATADIEIQVSNIGFASASKIVVKPFFIDPVIGNHSISVSYNGSSVTPLVPGATAPTFEIDLAATNDLVELAFGVESNAVDLSSALAYTYELQVELDPNEAGAAPPTVEMEGTVKASANFAAGESGNSSAFAGNNSAFHDGPTMTTGLIEFPLDNNVQVNLSANSSFSAVPEPSAFCLLGLLASVGILRKKWLPNT